MRRRELLGITAAIAGAALGAAPASALVFSFADAGGAAIGTAARADFEIAGRYWSSVLTDDVTVNLDIAYRPLDAGLLGQTFTNRATVSVAQVYAALATDRTTPLDLQAVANLPPVFPSSVSPAFGALAPVTNAPNAAGNGYVAGVTRIDADGSVNNSVLSIARADAKALGIAVGAGGLPLDGSRIDAVVTLNSAAAFDFDPADGVEADQQDFLTTAIHEFGHALGFISGVDDYDRRSAPTAPARRPACWKARRSPRRSTCSATIRRAGWIGRRAAARSSRSTAVPRRCSATGASPQAPTMAAATSRCTGGTMSRA